MSHLTHAELCERNTRIIRSVIKAVDERDWPALDKLLASSYRLVDVRGTEYVNKQDALAMMRILMDEELPETRIALDAVLPIATGGTARYRWINSNGEGWVVALYWIDDDGRLLSSMTLQEEKEQWRPPPS